MELFGARVRQACRSPFIVQWAVRAALLAAVAAALAAGLPAGALLGSRADAAPASGPAHGPANVVLITLDTTRADHLGAWGWPHARTPSLDALAGRGVRFARCDTAAPITLPSHTTLMTGLYPPRHGVRDNGTFTLAPRFETLAERLAARGYDTAAVVSAVVLARRHGLDQGFRLYDDDLGSGYAAGTEVAERTAEKTTAAALAVLPNLRPPFFLWAHYYDPHEEYRPPTRFADAAQGPHRLYDGEIAYMDEQVGALLARLPANTVVAVVGDHGEMLGEHGEASHGLLLYAAARRVPLILAGPGLPSGRVVDCLVPSVALPPTLLALTGAPVPAGLDGASLLPLQKACGRPSYSESFLPFFAYKWYPLRALSTDRFLYIQAPVSSLYDLLSARGEGGDLALAQPAAARRWQARLAELLRARGEALDPAVRTENVLSEEQRKQLASLGYVGASAAGQVTGKLPDPRRMTDVAQALHRAAEEVQAGKCATALPALDAIVKRDAHNFPALSLAGFCLKEAKRTEAALALFQRAAKENELSAVPVADAGLSLLDLGREREAERELRRALTLDPTLPAAASNLGRLLRKRGDLAAAAAVLDGALAAGAHASEIYLERGVVRAERGEIAAALSDFREGARRSPTDPVPIENAAKAAYQLGRAAESAQLYEQLLRLAPDRRDLWKTVGALYLYELDDRAAALRSFRRALTLEIDPAERAKLEALVRELGG